MDNDLKETGIKISNLSRQAKERKTNISFIPTNNAAKSTESSVADKSRLMMNKSQSWMEKIPDFLISVSFFMVFLGVPLFFIGLTFQGIVFEKQIYFYFWALLALVAWVSKGIIRGELEIKRTPLDIPLLLLWAIFLVSTIFSVDRWHSFWGFFGDPSRGFLAFSSFTIFYYILFGNFTSKRLYWMLGGLLTSAAVVSAWTILALSEARIFPTEIMRMAPFSLIGSISGLAIFLGSVIPIAVASILEINRGEINKVIKLSISGLLVMLLLSIFFIFVVLHGFVPWVGLLLGLGFFVIFILSQIVRYKGKWSFLPMAVFAAVLLLLMIGEVGIFSRQLPMEVGPSYGLSWQVLKESVKENPFFGSGPGTYGYAFSAFRPQNFNLHEFYGLRFYQGSGMLFEAVSTLGILGAVSLVVLALSFLGIALYLLVKKKTESKIFSLGLISGSLVLIVSSVLTMTTGTILFLVALFGSLALAVLYWESDIKPNSLNLSIKASPQFALALAFLFMVVSAGVIYLFVFIGRTLVADIYAGEGVRSPQVSEDGSLGKMSKAIGLYAREGRYYSRAGQEYMVLANQEMLKSEEERNTDKIIVYLNNAAQFSQKGYNLMQNDVLAAQTLAQIYENSSFYVEEASRLVEDYYNRALELEPHNPDFYVKLGQLKMKLAASKEKEEEKKSNWKEAEKMFKKSLDEKENYAVGYYNLALVQEFLGETDIAIENMGKALFLFPQNVDYGFNLGRLYANRGGEDDLKIAESIYRRVIELDANNINSIFSFGLLYEKTQRNNEAIEQYAKAKELLSDDQEELKKRIEEMIENVKNGKGNIVSSQSAQPLPEEISSEEGQKQPELVEPEPSQFPVGR